MIFEFDALFNFILHFTCLMNGVSRLFFNVSNVYVMIGTVLSSFCLTLHIWKGTQQILVLR